MMATCSIHRKKSTKTWRQRLLEQGPWCPDTDPLPLTGVPAIPMPVTISDAESLQPFFAFLRSGSDTDHPNSDATEGQEPYYEVHLLEFVRGVLYDDRRMDLCKQVLGPIHIQTLMEALEKNKFVRHFLLGNNIIGPAGARSIAQFIGSHPDQIETWYIAGNCIGGQAFDELCEALVGSPVVTNLWLKRNPLSPEAVPSLFKLMTMMPNLRTLDLDQTELGDAGVCKLFTLLNDVNRPLPVRHLYLNGNGIGRSAAEQIGRYLSSDTCTLKNLYLSNNPIGSDGTKYLAQGLRHNKTIEVLSLQSVGMTDTGANALLEALASHPTIRTLEVGQSYATEDLNTRFNYLTDESVPALNHLIANSKSLRYLNPDLTAMSTIKVIEVLEEVADNESLYFFRLKTVNDPPSSTVGNTAKRLKKMARLRLELNVCKDFRGLTYDKFEAEELRWLISPRDVRYIDSVYRNRDAGLARRGIKVLDKWWPEDSNTLDEVSKQL